MYGSRHLGEVLRVNTRTAEAPNSGLMRHVDDWSRISKLAARGGVVLSALSLPLACRDMSAADSNAEKNEMLVESVASLGLGVAGGWGISVLLALAATPVGWVAALIIAGGAATAGTLGGKGARWVYNQYGQPVDLIKGTGLDRLC